MVSQNLLEFASKNYGFDVNTFKVEYAITFPDQKREIYVFNKDGKEYILKCDPCPERYIRYTRAKMDFICYLAENNVSVASPLKTSKNDFVISEYENGINYIITALEKVSGQRWDNDDPDKWNDRIFYNWGKVMGDIHHLAKDYKPAYKHDVRDFYDGHYWGSFFDCLTAYPDVYNITTELLNDIVDLPRDKDSYGLIHGDMHPDNFYIEDDKIKVFDFGDSTGWFAQDIGIALFDALWWGRKDNKGNNFTNTIIENFLKGYLSANQLSDFWISKIPMFMKYRQISAFVPWFFNSDDTEEQYQKEWKCNIENGILFDEYDWKSISDIIENSSRYNKQGKVVIIGGCPRAGKTTLSVKLVQSGKGFSKISGDQLGDAFLRDFDRVKTLLESLVEDAGAYGVNAVFDYYPDNFTLSDIEKLPFKDKLDIYFLGFPDIPVDKIKYNIMHYAEPTDWIYAYNTDDDYLEVVAKRIYDFNIKIKEDCAKYGYRYINTGVGDDRAVILNSLYNEIIEKC
ncbi:MAG: phosphotransferase [Oscillospiraceae bacterium]|nr:phosphotransferase [Oscillospiraceae bacterium]